VVSGGLSKVNEKLNTPVRALVLSFVLSELCVAIYSFSSWVFSFVNFTLIAGVVNIPWGLAGLLFPYMRKEMFDNAPSIVRKKVAGIPVISIIGLAVIIIGFFSVYFDLLTPAYSGPVGQEYIILTALPFIAPAAIYLVSKSYHKSHGIDLSLAFKQIPPE
jgi:amino acid transporter